MSRQGREDLSPWDELVDKESSHESVSVPRVSPGKVSLTSQLPAPRVRTSPLQAKTAAPTASQAVQRSAVPDSAQPATKQWLQDPLMLAAHGFSDTSDAAQAPAQDVHATAAQGVAGAGGGLPHGATIQKSFGRHDVSGISAHTGEAATQANEAIGAQAYATGDQVAFRDQPSLHTAAHEAAHIVQQRAGVSVPGGVGRSGDVYERHADAVADRVVRGDSAERLLDESHGESGAGSAVQGRAGAAPSAFAAGGAVVQKRDEEGEEPQPQQGGGAVDAAIATLQFTAPQVSAQGTTLAIADAVTFTESVQQRVAAALQTYAGLAEDDADRERLATAIRAGVQQAAGHMTTMANTIRTELQTLLNNSSPVNETPAQEDTPAQAPEQPTLPEVADVDRLRSAGAGLSRSARDTSGALTDEVEQTLADAAGEVADAALAIYQGRAVLSARADWTTGYRQGTVAAGGGVDMNSASSTLRRQQGAQDGLNDVFADSGFNRYGVQAEQSGNTWEPADWCGMFVVTHLFRSSGLDGELRSGFWETSNVMDFFNYTQVANADRVPVTIWVPDENSWMDLHAYHQSRGSERTWTPRATITQEIQAGHAPFRSGDVCLINHSGGDTAQHIVMVDSYDAATGALRTIEGNTLGLHSGEGGLIERNDEGEFARDRGQTSVGIHIREMNGDLGDREGDGAYENRAGNTVLGCGRLSAVDFEDHRYSNLPLASIPEALRGMSPEQMSTAQQGQASLETSRTRGPAAGE